MPYRTTQRADQDIIDIYLHGCREFGEVQAERYHAGLEAVFNLLASNPRLARERADFHPPIRLYPYHAHLIAYLQDAAGVLIIRVLHGRQDWEQHL